LWRKAVSRIMVSGSNMSTKAHSSMPPPLVDPVASESLPRVTSLFVEGLARRLASLCASTGLSQETASVADGVLRNLIVPWSRVEDFARRGNDGWVSEISDDNTPIEFSVTLSPAGSEVRVLFEPQGEAPTLASHRDSALRMHELLAERYAADLSRFKLVQDLFTPPEMQGPFALWSAVVFADGKAPSFKAYFNPQAQGVGRAVALVDEGLRRLGMTRAWHHLAATIARRGPYRDELKYFALDLSASEQARVKVYVRHHDATPEDLERAATAAPGSTPGEVQDFARAMGGGERRFKERATFTCAAFVGGRDDRPSATTQYVPVCAYALDDLEVEQRVSSYLRAHGMDDAPYRHMLNGFANRQLNGGVGLQSWVAFRRYQGVPRLTVYLGTETRQVFPVGSVPADTREHTSFRSASAVMSRVAQYGLSEHPLVRALPRLGEHRQQLWLLLNNTFELLTNTTELSEHAIGTWLEDNSAFAPSLSPELSGYPHLFAEAVQLFDCSPDAIEALAARSAARSAVQALAGVIAEFLEAEAVPSHRTASAEPPTFERRSAQELAKLDSAGIIALPSVIRGAWGVHKELWAALDRLAALSFGAPPTIVTSG